MNVRRRKAENGRRTVDREAGDVVAGSETSSRRGALGILKVTGSGETESSNNGGKEVIGDRGR